MDALRRPIGAMGRLVSSALRAAAGARRRLVARRDDVDVTSLLANLDRLEPSHEGAHRVVSLIDPTREPRHLKTSGRRSASRCAPHQGARIA